MDKRQNERRKCLATAYEKMMKGVMDGEIFVLLNNQIKRECDPPEEEQQRIRV